MNYVREIEKLNLKDLDKFVKARICVLENKSKVKNNYDTIGYDVDYNSQLQLQGEDNSVQVPLNCCYKGYIPKGIRIVYGLVCEDTKYIGNSGKYYYVDDDSYILDFCKYIKDKNIINEYELFDYILEFCKEYFGDNKKILYGNEFDREEMFKLLYKDNNTLMKPFVEHGLSWFKGAGNALCSEYSLLANNLMNFFGIDSYIIVGNQKNGDCSAEGHAFNLISFYDSENNCDISAIIDYGNHVDIVNSKFDVIGSSPFLGILDEDVDYLEDLIKNQKHLSFCDYFLAVYDCDVAWMECDSKRDYYIDNVINMDKLSTNKSKKLVR